MTSVFSQAKVSPALSCHHIGQDLRLTYSYLLKPMSSIANLKGQLQANMGPVYNSIYQQASNAQ